MQSDGSATNADKEQSRIDLERSRDALDDLRKEGKKLAAEQKKWRKEGVNGTDEVKSAQENLNDALDAQKDAYEDLRDAARDVDRARADGARSVADAIRQSQRAMEDANRASRDTAAAMEEISTEQQKVEDAFGKLGPAGQRFARFLHGLREGFFAFRNDVQKVLLPQIEEAIASFLGSSNGSVLRKSLIALADSFGAVAVALSLSFQGEAWGQFFEMLGSLGPEIQEAWGQAFIYFLEAMASILTTLAPYALEFAEGFAAMMEAFAGWAASEEGAEGIQRFMDYVKQIGPSVLEFFGLFVLAMTNVMVALAPYGELILGLLTGFLDFIANMDTDTLGLMLSALLVLITASQVAYALLNLLLAGRVLLGSAIGLLAFSFVALGLAIYYVYTQNETLGKALAILAGVIYGVVLALKIWRATAALITAIQIGLAAASYGAAGATYAQAGAARFAYVAARLWAGAQWLVVAAMNGTLLQIIRMNAAMALMIAKQKAIIVVTKLWAVAQRILNAVMRANPLGLALTAVLAIVAGFVWAYKRFETFRNIVDGVIGFLKDAFFGLWDFLFGHSVMPDIVDGMEWFFDQVKRIFGWVNTYAIQPLASAFKWLWKNVIKPVLGFMVAYYTFVFKAMKAVWTNVLWPVLKVIGKVVWTLWKAYFKVALTLIKAYFTLVFKALKWVWENVLRPAFEAMGKVLNWLWDKIFKPIFTWIGDKVGDTFKGIKTVWDKVLKPVFDFMVDKALPKLKGAFEKAVDGIKKIWDGLKKVVGSPVKFVLDTVINKGLIGGFNKVAKWVGMDGFNEINIPDSLQSYATGGVMPGYTPGRDPHKFISPTGGRLELSGGEAIMRPEFTAAVGTGFVDAANAAARSGGIDGVRRLLGEGGQAFARGGIFYPLPGARMGTYPGHDGVDLNVGSGWDDDGMPFYSATSGRVSYTGSGRGYGNAVFVNSPFGELVYGHSQYGSIGVSVGQAVQPGSFLARVGNTGNSSAPHLHFGFPGGPYAGAVSLLSGSYQGTGERPPKAAGFSMPKIPSWLKDLVKSPIDSVKGWVTSKWDKATDMVKGSPAFDVAKRLPLEAVKGVKDRALDMVPGWVKNAVGGIGKVADKVGDFAGAVGGGVRDGVSAAGDALGFADGGVLPYNGTMKYDSGGYLPPGLTSVMNLTGKPEPVFTNDQWAQMGGGAPGGGIHYEPHFEGSDLTAADVAGDLNFTFRKIRRGGRYEEVGRP